MDNDTARAIDELTRTVSAHLMQMSIQMIEVQAYVEALVERDNSRLVATGQSAQDVARTLQAQLEANRNRVYKAVSERFQLVGLSIDGPIQ